MDYPKSVPNVGLVGGKFVDENPTTGQVGSLIPAAWGAAVTDELLSVISAAGLVPNEAINNQVLLAIRTLILGTQNKVLIDTGSAGAYAAVNAIPLTVQPATGYVQRVSIANPNPGASTYSPDDIAARPIYGLGLQPLQGGELPVGVAVFMYLVQAGVNSGNGAWILIESLGGASQVAPATKSQHAIQLRQMAAIVGGMRNARMSVTAASASATFTADEIAVKTAMGGSAWLLPNFNKTIDLGVTGAGGMDVGAAPANGFVALYAIYNPTTQASALLAVNATSVKAPEVYGGANMPAGYNASALVSVVPVHSVAGQFGILAQFGRDVFYPQRVVLNSTVVVGTLTALSIVSAVPLNAGAAYVSMGATQTAAGNGISLVMATTATSVANIGVGAVATAGTVSGGTAVEIPVLTAQTLYYIVTASAGGSYTAAIRGYKF